VQSGKERNTEMVEINIGAGSARRVNARIDCCILTARNHSEVY